MANEVYGPFQSTEETVNQVVVLELKGFKAENITIFANKDHADELSNSTDVSVESNKSADEAEPSLIEKVRKTIFMEEPDSPIKLHEKLEVLGLSNEQITKYKADIESGKVIIIANDELKMGNDATPDTVRMEEGVIKRHG